MAIKHDLEALEARPVPLSIDLAELPEEPQFGKAGAHVRISQTSAVQITWFESPTGVSN